MNTLTIVVALIVGAAILWWRRPRFARHYRERACTGAKWRRAFPHASKAQIRRFLDCLVEGMMLPEKARLQFEPDDRVIDIYRSTYGGRTPVSDNLECETFIANLASAFGMPEADLYALWHERISLGEFFAHVLPAPVGAQAGGLRPGVSG